MSKRHKECLWRSKLSPIPPPSSTSTARPTRSPSAGWRHLPTTTSRSTSSRLRRFESAHASSVTRSKQLDFFRSLSRHPCSLIGSRPARKCRTTSSDSSRSSSRCLTTFSPTPSTKCASTSRMRRREASCGLSGSSRRSRQQVRERKQSYTKLYMCCNECAVILPK